MGWEEIYVSDGAKSNRAEATVPVRIERAPFTTTETTGLSGLTSTHTRPIEEQFSTRSVCQRVPVVDRFYNKQNTSHV